MAKTKNISLRLEEDDLKLAFEATGINKPQKLIDHLLSEFVRPLKIKKHPFFISSTMADDAQNTPMNLEWEKLQCELLGKIEFIPQPRQMEPPDLIGMEKMFHILEIEKQITAIKSEIKPSIIPKANWERNKQKRISALQNQLK